MIYKSLQSGDIITRRSTSGLQPLFSSSAFVKKTTSGWNEIKNTAFTESPSVTGSVYYARDDRFAVAYGSERTSSLYSEYLIWNSVMDAIGTPFDIEDNQYNFYIENERITDFIAITFNSENIAEGLDYDNFFIVMSGSTSTSSFTDISGTIFNVTQSLVVAPFYIKDSVNDLYFDGNNRLKSNQMTPTYELRTNTDPNFLTFDEGLQSININWALGTGSLSLGMVYPELGLVLLFPQKFNRTQITNAINSSDNRALNSLNSIQYMAGYATKKSTKKTYFVRFLNNEFNSAYNKTQYEILDNETRIMDLYRYEPTTFITQIGLYNNWNELLAVGFLSQPFVKNELNENLIKVEIEM
jgi:hypothetical protein